MLLIPAQGPGIRRGCFRPTPSPEPRAEPRGKRRRKTGDAPARTNSPQRRTSMCGTRGGVATVFPVGPRQFIGVPHLEPQQQMADAGVPPNAGRQSARSRGNFSRSSLPSTRRFPPRFSVLCMVHITAERRLPRSRRSTPRHSPRATGSAPAALTFRSASLLREMAGQPFRCDSCARHHP